MFMFKTLNLFCIALTPFAIALSASSETRSKAVNRETVDMDSARKIGTPYKSSDIIGLNVDNNNDQVLGRAEDLAIDLRRGSVVSLVISTGSFLGGGDYIAVPPDQVGIAKGRKTLLLNSTPEKLKTVPTFKAEQWRDFYASERWSESAKFFNSEPRLMSDPNHIQRASKVVGMTVKNKKDEKIGSVENLMIDLNNKKVVAVVISSGGFLGIGDTLSAVPPRLFDLDAENNVLVLETTKEALQQAPHFKQNDWPDFSQPVYVEGVYNAFHLNINSEYDENVADADNTARNIRDRDGRNVTPLDQGNNPRDLGITQQIRKAVVENKSLSLSAQNIKVITVDGQVTLRGPVQTAEEKRIIGDIAASVASKGKVENQLEVKKGSPSLTEM